MCKIQFFPLPELLLPPTTSIPSTDQFRSACVRPRCRIVSVHRLNAFSTFSTPDAHLVSTQTVEVPTRKSHSTKVSRPSLVEHGFQQQSSSGHTDGEQGISSFATWLLKMLELPAPNVPGRGSVDSEAKWKYGWVRQLTTRLPMSGQRCRALCGRCQASLGDIS